MHGGSEIVAARKMSFSGYPGVIYRCLKLYTGAKSDIQTQENTYKSLFSFLILIFFSGDDFTVTSTGLAVNIDMF